MSAPTVESAVVPLTCPTSPGEIVGCGSTNVSEPDFEGLVDCFDCGLWFDPAKEVAAL